MGRLNILFPMVILSGVFCLAMWLPASTIETVIAFISLYGFCSGVFISVTNAAVAQILPREKQGARQGAFFVLTAVATLIGSPIGGALIKSESRAGYQPMIIFSVRSCFMPILNTASRANTLINRDVHCLLGVLLLPSADFFTIAIWLVVFDHEQSSGLPNARLTESRFLSVGLRSSDRVFKRLE